MAGLKGPAEITPWHGPTRGFSFAREVQPVLDAKCISCHNGATVGPTGPLISLRGDQPMPAWSSKLPGMQNREWGGKFSIACANLHRFVRHPGIDSDMRVLSPMDVHAETTELVQTLRKGHYGVNGALVSARTGSYHANPWGLRDMHGNVAEWTRSEYRPYPYVEDDGRNQLSGNARRVVRGGSWRDRPSRATSSYRLSYRPYQPVFNVGFRVILQEEHASAGL